MGIGRRNFLKLTGLAVAGLAINPLQSVITNNNIYINKKLGILFYKPNDWGFINIKDFGKLKNEQILGNGWEDYKEEVWEDLGDPICIITKYYQDLEENKGIFSPTITLNITPKEELESYGFNSFEELMELSEKGVAQILRDFKVVKRYEPFLISGNKFYECDSEYLFEHIEINEPLKVELKTLKTEHNGFYYDFNFHQSKAQNQIASIEFENFKKTIKLL
ncbi:twin-arginine translocation signal domain-containing protein [Flavobacterium sp. H122]|uniref:twin-arginine translocation signal domain-containing protein n=1 Tax=Flavobacterium sp. H122 TaxID=2529860 RepID=UPI0010A9ED3F|nr:twin-arginine translocation signal domain-containing protein [Flavobacterium sp. H122]